MSSPFDLETRDHREDRRSEQPLPSPRQTKEKPATVQELNLTSMLDVIFQLLIFFVLTATFAVGEGMLPADLPKGTGPTIAVPIPPARPMDIHLTADGAEGVRITVDGASLANFNALYDQLRMMHADNGGTKAADNPIILKADRHVQWRHVVNALNQCRRAKFTRIELADPKV